MPEVKEQDEGTLTVLLALFANLGVGLLKLVAGLISGSGALLSEAAHSAGDSTTEVLLLVAQRRSRKPADVSHPFGYGKERYFWSMLAAVAIYVSGAAFSVYEGVTTIFGAGEDSKYLWINYPVLLLAAVLEGLSLRQAAGQMRKETERTKRSLAAYLRTPRDPTVNSVLLEDTAAMIGLAIAAVGVGLHQLTGSSVWDGAASIAIGALLLAVTAVLARACQALLIGQQADPRLIDAVVRFLEEQQEVDDVVDVLTMLTGTDSVLLCTRVDFVDSFSAADLELACVRVDEQLREKFPMLGEVFIQPASRKNSALRRRVTDRYGHALADG
ncbi:MAG: cation diffusion facilitator family transporter [Jatrophihabitans sp.]|uniref:cation diffusion facilitator family transporter n=1 Tax=Jatrophihabitans sp. TaxID=1932789 RepID=UPI00391691AA